jgi:DMSO/TMAO reductase YedYZ molybdopterin-dependent catalytic subunit
MLRFNEKVLGGWRGLTHRLVPEVPQVTNREPRVNGDIGLEDPDQDLSQWKLQIKSPVSGNPNLILGIADIHRLPRTEISINFKCIEGWSEDMTCAGVRFSDFLAACDLGKRGESGYFDYVALITPDRKYYVSLDMESMLHPQTLLCYEMNGAPLSYDNGAPLRLIIPIKYGIKNLKQIGTVSFSDTRPPDYWAEQGYDWYAGL